MKASELITQLSQAISVSGDLNILRGADDGHRVTLEDPSIKKEYDKNMVPMLVIRADGAGTEMNEMSDVDKVYYAIQEALEEGISIADVESAVAQAILDYRQKKGA